MAAGGARVRLVPDRCVLGAPGGCRRGIARVGQIASTLEMHEVLVIRPTSRYLRRARAVRPARNHPNHLDLFVRLQLASASILRGESFRWLPWLRRLPSKINAAQAAVAWETQTSQPRHPTTAGFGAETRFEPARAFATLQRSAVGADGRIPSLTSCGRNS